MRALLFVAIFPGLLAAQMPPDLLRDRVDFAHWLADAPNSPLAAVAQVPIGTGIRLGPADADVPLPEFGPATITESKGVVTLERGPDRRVLPRNRLTLLGGVSLFPGGLPGRTVVTVFGPDRKAGSPSWYPFNGGAVFVGPMTQVDRPRSVRVLAPDGIEVEATEVGTVVVPDSGGPARLHVYRIPDPGTEESELTVYFQDATNGQGTYPAGRFVSLMSMPDGRFRLDFNRARNPFCAYSAVYACPAPWPGNRLPARGCLPGSGTSLGRERSRATAPDDRPGPRACGRRHPRGKPWRRHRSPLTAPRRRRPAPGARCSTWPAGPSGSRITSRGRRRLARAAVQRRPCTPSPPSVSAGDTSWWRWPTTQRRSPRRCKRRLAGGRYSNVGNRGPTVIPFRAARGEWAPGAGPTGWCGQLGREFLRGTGARARGSSSSATARRDSRGPSSPIAATTDTSGAGRRRQLLDGPLRRLVRIHGDRPSRW